jgi:hypothetical protein
MKQNWIAFGATVAAAGLGIAYWRLLATWTRFSASIGLNILLGMLHSDTRLPGYGPSAFGGFDHALTRTSKSQSIERWSASTRLSRISRTRLRGRS